MARVDAGRQDELRDSLATNPMAAASSKSLGLEEMLNSALERVLEATGMDAGVVHLLGEDTDAGIVAHRGLSAERLREMEQIGLPQRPAGQAAVSGEASTPSDGAREQRLAPELAEGMGFRAQTCIPIPSKGEVLGGLCLFGQRPGVLSRQEMGLLAAVADAMAVGVKNARVLGRLREADEQISALLRSAMDGEFDVSFPNPYLVKCWVGNKCDDANCPAYQSHDLRCWQIAGTLCPEGAQGRFARKLASCRECQVFQKSCRRDVITSIGESFNDMLFVLRSEARQRAEMAKQLIEKLMSAQEDERKRVARELHEQTSQSLTALLVGLKTLESTSTPRKVHQRAAELEDLTLQALDEVHRLALELRPAALDELGLAAALRDYLKETSERCSINMDLRTVGMETRLAPAVETALYRIVQESVTNVIRHAQAQNVVVSLERQGSLLIARIRDDGRGFSVDRLRQRAGSRKGLGLVGMRERAMLLGGRFTVESEPGRGTTVSVEIPLELEAFGFDLQP